MRRWLWYLVVALAAWTVPAAGQTPQPFPRPGESRPQTPRPADSRPPATATAPAPSAGQLAPAVAPAAPGSTPNAPKPEEVVFPIYPGSQFIGAYDAGRGQRYILYGASATFAEIVAYYRMQIGDKGDLVFKEPPTHVFEVGRF